MASKRIIVVIDNKTSKTLNALQKEFGINRSATIRYCINYTGVKIRRK